MKKMINYLQNQYYFIFYLMLCCFFFVSYSSDNVSITSNSPTRCHTDQASALLQFKQEFRFEAPYEPYPDETYGCPKMKLWKEAKDCCSWDGVVCNTKTGQVVSLDLSCGWLHGSLLSNSSLFSLHQLRRLNLAFNDFNSSTIPSEFGRLSRLTHLNLSSSFFSVHIPAEISWLTKLISLDLSRHIYHIVNDDDRGHFYHKKVDIFTRLVENATNLEELHLDRVNLSSSVHESVANLSFLTSLSLIECNLLGKFPKNIFQLPYLQVIDVSLNINLTGSLPEFRNDSNLRKLILHDTSFSGTLSSSIGSLKSLNLMDIAACRFSGTFPSSLGNLSDLTYLDLSFNQFTANQFPLSIGKLGTLTRLFLSSTQLNGEVPAFLLGNLTQLQGLSLSDNHFSGQILSSLVNLTQLESLSVSRNNFSGQIPSPFGNLIHLQTISISNNNFDGQIPSSIGNLTKLEELDLSHNCFEGVIPFSLFTIPSLEIPILQYNKFSSVSNIPNVFSSTLLFLDLGGNKFTQIPKSISKLTNLVYLSLHSNDLSGTIELDIFSELREFDGFDLSFNNISLAMSSTIPNFGYLICSTCNIREFPEFLKSQGKLDVLELSDNKIEGYIPNWFLNVSSESLETLNLSHNFLSGWEKTPLFLPWKNLKCVDLHSNKFQGPLVVPPFSTVYFIFSENNLSGSIPPLFCNLSFLELLDVSGNQLTGTIPECWGKFSTSLSELKTLDLSNNQLQGKVPSSLVQCRKLEVLNLGRNQICDTFPLWLTKLPELQVLVLASNKFYGPIWHRNNSLNFVKLKIIDLSFNKFNESLPSEYFRSWRAMAEVSELSSLSRLSSKNFPSYMSLDDIDDAPDSYYDTVTVMDKGLEMVLMKIVTTFTSIDLSYNNFSGEIPRSIGHLQSLHVLNLSSNNFTGPIPSCFEKLRELESLDLSKNKFSGRIPQQLVKLTFLAYLNLSQNHLTGFIPQGGQFATFPSSAFEGNSGLCGLPLAKKCEDSDAPTSSHNCEIQSRLFDFGWRVVLMGYCCGFVVGVVLGQVMISKRPNWFGKMFAVNIQRRRR